MMNARAPFSLARPSEDISRPMHDVASVYVGSNDPRLIGFDWSKPCSYLKTADSKNTVAAFYPHLPSNLPTPYLSSHAHLIALHAQPHAPLLQGGQGCPGR
eukprot:scaffold157276_cov23-Cyclotella_meneghiniana.AAC.1